MDAFLGLDELDLAPAAQTGPPILPRFTEKLLATRLQPRAVPRILSRRRGYATLKVGEGCDSLCTFCTIPYTRGKHVTKPIEKLVAEARRLAADGVRELVLDAQDMTRLRDDRLYEPAQAREVRRVLVAVDDRLDPIPLRLPELRRRRFGARRHRAVTRSFRDVDIPLQHVDAACSRDVLRRRTRVRDGDADLAAPRDACPNLVVRTTFTSGSPARRGRVRGVLAGRRRDSIEHLGAFTYLGWSPARSRSVSAIRCRTKPRHLPKS